MATLKSRQILSERQAAAKASIKEYNNPSTLQKLALQNKRALQSKSFLDYVQNPLGILGGVVSNSIQKVVTGEILENTALEGLSLSSGTLSYTKLWRYRLLMKGSNGMEQTEYSPRPTLSSIVADALPFVKSSGDDSHLHTTKPESLSAAEKSYPGNEPEKIKARRLQSEEFIPAGINYVKAKFEALEQLKNDKSRLKNQVKIINASVSPYQAIILQNRPNEITIDPKSNWAAVHSMGRNVPFMMYTGGEETVSFDVSWFANDPARRDEVLWKCKLLESWSRADGYSASPPVLILSWGKSKVFRNDQYYILESARYILKNFQDLAKSNDQIIDLHLNPAVATQSLVFKRISMTNLTHEDIVPLEELLGTDYFDSQGNPIKVSGIEYNESLE